MPTQSFTYPYTLIGSDGKNHIFRPYVPVIITCTKTKRWMRFMALADTGADKCLMPGAVTKILGCAVNTGATNGGGARGIGDGIMATWKHSLTISLISPDKQKTIWTGPELEIDCLQQNDKPVLLGSIGFFENFVATFNHPKKSLTIEFEIHA